MREYEIAYLKVSGTPIGPFIADAIFSASRRVMIEHGSQTKIRSRYCEGHVRTEWKWGVLGGILGIIFDVETESEDGKTTARMIVTPGSEQIPLEDSRWESIQDATPRQRHLYN